MNDYYGPGDVLAVTLNGRFIGSTLTTLEPRLSAAVVDPTGLGEKWDRFVGTGVRKGNLTHDGWMPSEVRDIFLSRNQIKADQMIIVPTGVAGHDVIIINSNVKATIDTRPAKDGLIGATINYAVDGQVHEDGRMIGYVERITPLDLRGDRAPVGGSFTTLSAVAVGSASGDGGTVYATADRIRFAPHYTRLRLVVADAANLGGALRSNTDFTVADSAALQELRGSNAETAIAGAIPRDLFLALLFQPEFTMAAAGPYSAGDTDIDIDSPSIPGKAFAVNDKIRFAGHSTVYTISAIVGATHTVAPALTDAVLDNAVVSPDPTDNLAEHVLAHLRRS